MALDLQIIADLKRQTPKVLRNEMQKRGRTAFQKIKNKMIAEFLNHPVTIEIKQGINAKNISGTLGGATNLYSFIGFDDSAGDPTKSIEDVLQQTNFEFATLKRNSIEFSIYMPDAKDVFDATPMPWAKGRSWAKGIVTSVGQQKRKRRWSSIISMGTVITTVCQTRWCYAVIVMGEHKTSRLKIRATIVIYSNL